MAITVIGSSSSIDTNIIDKSNVIILVNQSFLLKKLHNLDNMGIVYIRGGDPRVTKYFENTKPYRDFLSSNGLTNSITLCNGYRIYSNNEYLASNIQASQFNAILKDAPSLYSGDVSKIIAKHLGEISGTNIYETGFSYGDIQNYDYFYKIKILDHCLKLGRGLTGETHIRLYADPIGRVFKGNTKNHDVFNVGFNFYIKIYLLSTFRLAKFWIKKFRW